MEWSWHVIFISGLILLGVRITQQAVNVALGGVASQSSTLDSSILPSVVIDGKPSSRYVEGSCIATLSEKDPWWRVDLRGVYDILSIELTLRSDCCTDWSYGAEIHIGNSLKNNGNSNPRCAVILNSAITRTLNCQMRGRYVNYILPGDKKFIHLCEVKVFATTDLTGVDLAPLGIATQVENSLWPAYQAIDGYPGRYGPQQTISHVGLLANPWWKLDLGKTYAITAVSLIRRNEYCCVDQIQGAEIRIGPRNDISNQRCAIISFDTADIKYDYLCGQMEGRFITVNIPSPSAYLTIAELHLYGHEIASTDYCHSDNCLRDYILVQNEAKTWLEAQADCRERYTDLATINNINAMSRVVDVQENFFDSFWMGLYEDVLVWRWSGIDGGSEAEYSNWDNDEPREGNDTQQCVVINNSGKWKVLDCTDQQYFICYDGRVGAPQTKVYITKILNWKAAQSYCRNKHTDLLSIRNEEEGQEALAVMGGKPDTWIGLVGETWRWSDGSDSPFRYWSQDPLASSGTGKKCVQVYKGQWHVKPCDTKSMFLCYFAKKKKTVFRIRGSHDTSDPLIQQQISRKLEAEMRERGISDVKIHWRSSEQVSQKKRSPGDLNQECATLT